MDGPLPLVGPARVRTSGVTAGTASLRLYRTSAASSRHRYCYYMTTQYPCDGQPVMGTEWSDAGIRRPTATCVTELYELTVR